MKPPLSAKGRIWRLLPLVAMLLIIGCRRPAEKPVAPPKQPEPSAATPTETPPVETPPVDMPQVETPPADTPAPAAKPPAETPSDTPSAETPVPATETPPAEQPAETPPAAAEKPAETPATETPPAEEPPNEKPEKPSIPTELRSPLGEDPAKLTALDPDAVVWIDKKEHRVVTVGQICQRRAPLEMFACPVGTKEHEAVVAIPAKAMVLHAALLAVGAEAGKPVQFQPKYVPASGTKIDVSARWKDDKGKIQSARAQDWVRNIKTRKPMEYDWVFAGSSFWTDDRTGKRYYQADGGDLICVSNFPSAMLDLPVESSQSDSELMFEAFTEHIPALGTPVTVILTPKLEKKVEKKAEKEPEKKPEN
jgi:hypothetical protein